MSLLSRSAIGIDVSDGTLKAVKLTRRGRRIRLVRTWRVAYYHEDGDPGANALDALTRFFADHPPGPAPTVVISSRSPHHAPMRARCQLVSTMGRPFSMMYPFGPSAQATGPISRRCSVYRSNSVVTLRLLQCYVHLVQHLADGLPRLALLGPGPQHALEAVGVD